MCIIGALATLRPTLDPDLGWHLRTGQLILQTHAIPTTDPYSFTVRGAPWVEQEWLWQAGAAALDNLAGWRGLALVNGLLVALALWLVCLRLRTRSVAPMFAALGAAVALVNLIPADEVRPAMVIVLFCAVYLLAFERYERGRDWRWLAALLPCQVVWANAHGSYVLGPFLCATYGAAALWQTRRWKSVHPWGALFCGLFVASVANPRGLGLLRFTFFAARLPFNRQYVAEWVTPNLTSWDHAPLLLSIVCSLALAGLCPAWPNNKAQLFLLAGCSLLVLQSEQFVPLYAVAAAPVLAEMLFYACGTPRRSEISPLSGAVLTTGSLAVAFMAAGHLSASAYSSGLAKTYPVNAVAFIERERLPGPMLNDYNWGGYLIGAMPGWPVFVDGRSEVYGESFLSQYGNVFQGLAPPDPLLDRYGVNLVLIRPLSPLATELRRSSRWSETFRDSTAAVFQRQAPALGLRVER